MKQHSFCLNIVPITAIFNVKENTFLWFSLLYFIDLSIETVDESPGQQSC